MAFPYPRKMPLFSGLKAILILFGVVSCAIAIYASRHVESMALNRPVIVTLGFVVFAVVFFWAARSLKHDGQMTVVIVVVASLFSLYVAELVVLWVGGDQVVRMIRGGLDLSFDFRSRLQAIHRLRSNGDPSAVPAVSPGIVARKRGELLIHNRLVLPLAGMSRRTTVACNEVGHWLSYPSDERGFRNPLGLWANPVDIALVGDSFGQGMCLPDEFTIAGHIRAVFPRTLNLSYTGNDPLIELAGIREYLTHIKPRVVIWLFYEGNDLLDLEIMLRTNSVILNYLSDPKFRQGLEQLQPEIDSGLAEFAHAEELSSLASFQARFSFANILLLRNLREVFGLGLGRAPTPTAISSATLLAFRKIMANAKSEVDSWSGRLVFVYLPQIHRYLPGLEPPPEERMFVLDTVRELGIAFVDLAPTFAAQSDPTLLWQLRYHLNHYSDRGSRLAAEEILKLARTITVDVASPTGHK